MSIAMSGHLGLKQETAFGVAAVPNVFGEISSESLAMDYGLHIPRMIGGIRGNKRVLPATLKGSGGFTYLLTPEDLIGWILKGAFGSVTTTNLGLGAYQHVFKPQSGSILPSFTTQVDAEAGCFNFLGSCFSGFSISMTPEDLIEMSIDMIPQTIVEAVAATPTYTTLDPFTPQMITVTLNGASNTDIESLEINATNELEGVFTLNGQRYIGKNVAHQFDCGGRFEMEFGDMTMLRRIWGNSLATRPWDALTAGSLTIAIEMAENDDATYGIIGTSAYHYKVQFDFHSIYFRGGQPNLTAPDDRIMQDIEFVTKYDTTNTAMMTVTLTNGQASYPDPS